MVFREWSVAGMDGSQRHCLRQGKIRASSTWRHPQRQRAAPCGELFKMMTGIDMVHVPYRSTAAVMTDLLSGPSAGFLRHHGIVDRICQGRRGARAGVTTATRSEVLPDIPTIAEFVPGYESTPWYGIGVPSNNACRDLDKLNQTINALLADPTVKAKFHRSRRRALPGTPADFARLVAEETDKWPG